ncbi:MAG: GHKL domain-containing protein [Bacilli bacterium]|nr:GHKL domain-containing protein [Bacilli bacterium]
MTEILDVGIKILSTILINTFTVFCWRGCLKDDSSIRKVNNVLLITIVTVAVTIIAVLLDNPVRMLVTYFILILINYILLTKNLKKSLYVVIISELIILFTELSFAILISPFINGNIESFASDPFIFLLLNIYISLISSLFLFFKIPQKVFNIINKSISSIKSNEVLISSIIIILILVISTAESYMKLPISIVLFTNGLMAVIFIVIVIKNNSIKSNYNIINSKYQTSISSLREFENVIDKFRVSTHENKNELLTIRNMIRDKKVVSYIDKLVGNKIKDNSKIMDKTLKIPDGGLRATIYSKLCLMDDRGINYKLEVSRDVKTVDLIDFDDNTITSMCRILGVFFDNSIQAVMDLDERIIKIDIYLLDSDLYIDISNNFSGSIDLYEISNTNYSSKGKNHGYGLLLVKKLIKENSLKMANETSIDGNMFTQSLIIKNIK